MSELHNLLQAAGDLKSSQLSALLALDCCMTLLRRLRMEPDWKNKKRWMHYFGCTYPDLAKLELVERDLERLRDRIDTTEVPARPRSRLFFRYGKDKYPFRGKQLELVCYLQLHGDSGEDELINHLWNQDEPNDLLVPVPLTKGRLRTLQSRTNNTIQRFKLPLKICRPADGVLRLQTLKKSSKKSSKL
jgi:hypothetical protein